MSKKSLSVYIDGQVKEIGPHDLKKLSPGFVDGFGVFETILLSDGSVHFLQEHYRRFLYGCDRYILPRPPALSTIQEIFKQLIKANGLKSGRLRLMAWRKSYDLHFAVVVVPREEFSKNIYKEGFAACINAKHLDRSPELAKIKSLDYQFFLRAYEYALEHDCHESLLLNSSGLLVEGSRSNVFVVKKERLLTPSLSCGCLAGVTREVVLKVAKKEGVRTSLLEINLADLKDSEEAFLTNALIGIMPLTYLGERKIGNGQPGPVTKRLMDGYKKLSRAQSTFLV